MKIIIVLNSNFLRTLYFNLFLSHCLHQFPIHNEKKSLMKKLCVHFLPDIFFSKGNKQYFFCLPNNTLCFTTKKKWRHYCLSSTFQIFQKQIKQTLCDKCIVLVTMCMYIWRSSSMFTMSYYVILLDHIKWILSCWWIPVSF